MADVVFVGIVVAFFGLAFGFVGVCGRIVGASGPLDTAGDDEAAGESPSVVIP